MWFVVRIRCVSGGALALPGCVCLSGPGQGRDGFAAVELEPATGFGEAFRLSPVGEDDRERDGVEAGPVCRAVSRAGQTGVLAEDAVSLAMVQVFDSPIELLLFWFKASDLRRFLLLP